MKQLTLDLNTRMDGLPVDRNKRIRMFCNTFGVRFSKVQDGFMTALAGEPTLDILKLDDILHEKFGNYENRGYSLDELVKREYGRETLTLINSLL